MLLYGLAYLRSDVMTHSHLSGISVVCGSMYPALYRSASDGKPLEILINGVISGTITQWRAPEKSSIKCVASRRMFGLLS